LVVSVGNNRAMANLGNVIKLGVPKCRHKYTWVVSYAEQPAATDAMHYVKYQQCRRCGTYLQRVA